MSVVSATIRPYVPFFPLHAADLFSVRYNGNRYELRDWQKAAIVITTFAGAILAGVGVLFGFCLSHYFRNQMVDQWMAQPPNPEADAHFYFDADYFEGTDRETAAPVNTGELFYQQKQIATFCSIHSLCNFTGRNIEGLVPTMIKANNAYLRNVYKNRPYGEEELEGMKRWGIYIESLQSIADHGGVCGVDLIRYMTQNKEKLYLPDSCTIQSVNGLIDAEPVQHAIHTIENDPSLHRVIVSVVSKRYGHLSAIRKDAAGQWRVLDSMQSIFHIKRQIQPSFPTLQQAIRHLLRSHHAENHDLNLIYPTEDQQPMPDMSTAADRSSSSIL